MRNGALLAGVLAMLAAPGRPACAAVEADGVLEAVQIGGRLQIKYWDRKGNHVLTVGTGDYFPDDLPADAEIAVLDADSTFRCRGAFIRAIAGTIFSAGEATGVEYLFVRQGELSVKLNGRTTIVDFRNPNFSFPRTRGRPVSNGYLR